MITITGSPKTGTHLLQKAVAMFGGECKLALHDHCPHSSKQDGKYLHIIRSPRNVVLSWIRFKQQEVNSQNYIAAIPQILSEMAEYVGWLSDPNEVLNVRFEELLTDPKQITRIGSFVGQPPIEDHFKNIWGGTWTFTGALSNWRNIWTAEIEQAWEDAGGVGFESALGYDITKEWIREI